MRSCWTAVQGVVASLKHLWQADSRAQNIMFESRDRILYVVGAFPAVGLLTVQAPRKAMILGCLRRRFICTSALNSCMNQPRNSEAFSIPCD